MITGYFDLLFTAVLSVPGIMAGTYKVFKKYTSELNKYFLDLSVEVTKLFEEKGLS